MAIPARDTIIKIIKENDAKTYVEVGCWQGELLSRVKDLGLQVWGIDPHKFEYNEFEDYHCRMAKAGEMVSQDELELIVSDLFRKFGGRYIRATSVDAANRFHDDSLDLVFIDAIHDYEHIKEDIQIWLPKVKKGGILAGDDYKIKRFPGLCRGVDELLPGRLIDGVVWYIKK